MLKRDASGKQVRRGGTVFAFLNMRGEKIHILYLEIFSVYRILSSRHLSFIIKLSSVDCHFLVSKQWKFTK